MNAMYKTTKALIGLLLIIFTPLLSVGNGSYQPERLRCAWYNVENLFDTIHQEGYNDREYTPEGFRHWTGYRLHHKCMQIYRVLTAVGKGSMPTIIGLCEVENDSSLCRLLRRTPLRYTNYKYILTQGDDKRGINVALLYRPDQVKLISHHFHSVTPPRHKSPTRQWVEAKVQLFSGDTLHIFLCHLPSRRGGITQSQGYRNMIASQLRHCYDSIITSNTQSKVIIMGDFNDTPTDKSITQGLKAIPISNSNSMADTSLFNLASPYSKLWEHGTNKYRTRWTTLDQIIVSGSLLQRSSHLFIRQDSMQIFSNGTLTEDKTHGGLRPKRTFYGATWEKGYSDHLAVYIDIMIDLHLKKRASKAVILKEALQ